MSTFRIVQDITFISRSKVKLVGILFLFEITQPRAANNPSMMNPTHILPLDPPGVCVVTTKWPVSADQSHSTEDVGREEQLRRLFGIQASAMKRFLNTPESAWVIINEVWGNSEANEVWDSSEASKVTLESVLLLLESIRPHLKEPDKLMRKIGRWFAKLF